MGGPAERRRRRRRRPRAPWRPPASTTPRSRRLAAASGERIRVQAERRRATTRPAGRATALSPSSPASTSSDGQRQRRSARPGATRSPRRPSGPSSSSSSWSSHLHRRSGSSGRWRWPRSPPSLHDILVTVGVYSVFGFEVTPATVIAFLTILGYSIYDGIVVFDRVDENAKALARRPARPRTATMVNESLNQVLMRTLNTSITALLPILSLLVVGSLHPRRHHPRGVRPRPAHRPRVRAPTRRSSSPRPSLALLKEREPRWTRAPPSGSSGRAAAPAPRRGDGRRAAGDGRAGDDGRRRRPRPIRRPTLGRRPPSAPGARPAGAAAVAGASAPDRASAAAEPRPPVAVTRWSSDASTSARLAHGPRHPRLPDARGRLQGHHAAAGRPRRVRRRHRRHRRRTSTARPIDRVLGIEARGFIVAAPVAYRFGAGFAPGPQGRASCRGRSSGGVRARVRHRPARDPQRRRRSPGERVLVVDDVLATGGTAAATVRLVERLGAEVVGLGFLIELAFLDGRAQLAGRDDRLAAHLRVSGGGSDGDRRPGPAVAARRRCRPRRSRPLLAAYRARHPKAPHRADQPGLRRRRPTPTPARSATRASPTSSTRWRWPRSSPSSASTT